VASLPFYITVLLPTEKTARILDIGCGLGDTLTALLKEGYVDVSGVDISIEAVDCCNSRGLKVAKVSGIEDVVIEDGGRRFDFIIMSHVLEHIKKDNIIKNLHYIKENLLSSEGGLYIQVPNAQSSTGCYWAYEDFTHHTLFTAGSLEFVLRSAGFTNIQFVNQDCTEGMGFLRGTLRRALLRLYVMKTDFWNWVTSSSFHRPSPRIYSYEIKAIAK
jgi:cyclopropane fatty-acyl-phospholipid synthase-like methyltransferase